jgi:hypothetical protein
MNYFGLFTQSYRGIAFEEMEPRFRPGEERWECGGWRGG